MKSALRMVWVVVVACGLAQAGPEDRLLSPEEYAQRACGGNQSCQNELLLLDRQLNVVYQSALRVHPDRVVLRDEQRAWLAGVRARCLDGACAAPTYGDRIIALNTLAMSGSR